MYQISLWFMKFILFSMIGYIVEMVECALDEGKFQNRGFFCGPILPIFGIGSLLLIWLLKPLSDFWWLVFFLGIFITTTLEYFGGYLIEKVFHNKWWDYSDEKFNLHGRICLKNSILFGIGSVIILYFLDPIISRFLIQVKDSYLIGCSIVIGLLFFLDATYSCIVAYNLRNHIIVVEDLKNQKLAKIPGMFEKMLTKRLKKMRRLPRRLFHAFPALVRIYPKELELIRKIEEKLTNKKKKKKKRK